MKSKYEIILQETTNVIFNEHDFVFTGLSKAMDIYAKQVAINFREWQDENLEDKRWENYDGHDTWINPHTREVISTEQLYKLFKEQTNDNK